MRKRLALTAVVAATAALAPHAHSAPAPTPQITDPAGDANGGGNHAAGIDKTLPNNAGNQAYADVLSVVWKPTKVTRKVGRRTTTTVTGFTVTATLSGAPTPPAPTSLVYRMLAVPPCGDSSNFFGVVWYTAKPGDANQPQSALRDNCTGETRLTPIAAPVIQGSTLTWTVPISVIPKETKVKLGTTLTEFYFEVREIEDFRGNCLPDDDGLTGYGNACGLGVGVLDNSPRIDASFRLG